MNKPRKTPTAEQKEWMKSTGYTESQIDSFWNENIDTNPIIKNLSSNGMTWRDMNLSCVKQLPTQKERDKKILEEKAQKDEAERLEQEKKRQEREYYREHFREIMLAKIDAKENLTEKELSEVVFGYEVDTEYGDNRRWTRTVTTIVELLGRFFSIDWEEGLTESQENEFYNQPVEVKKNTYEKTIVVTEWVAIGGANEQENA
ncbi:MAG: hypothetical protein PHR82_08820 [Endomicrobiaceae bacterium]|nr:hypothetical protein [Endomicrobiaceae bacterium]